MPHIRDTKEIDPAEYRSPHKLEEALKSFDSTIDYYNNQARQNGIRMSFMKQASFYEDGTVSAYFMQMK